jgi:hypothetical protein
LRFSIKDGSLGKAAVRRRQAQKPAARSHLRHFCHDMSCHDMSCHDMSCHDIAALKR